MIVLVTIGRKVNRMKSKLRSKLRSYGPIIILSFIFYMMISTPHSRALGDIVLESFRLKSWTDGYIGTHLTVIYFGILFLIVYIIYKRFVNDEDNKKRKYKIMLFIASVTMFYLVHSAFVHMSMGNAEGLNTIAIAPDGNSYKYKIVDGELDEFECEFNLINYSRKTKYFTVEGYINELVRFEIYNKQDELIQFFLRGKGTENYRIDNENYNIKIYGLDKHFSGGGRGIIDSLILIDDEGNSTKIVKLRDRGIEK